MHGTCIKMYRGFFRNIAQHRWADERDGCWIKSSYEVMSTRRERD